MNIQRETFFEYVPILRRVQIDRHFCPRAYYIKFFISSIYLKLKIVKIYNNDDNNKKLEERLEIMLSVSHNVLLQ